MVTDTLGQMLESACCGLCSGDNARVLFVVRDRYDGKAIEFPVVRCQTCSLVYVNPRPTSESISAFYPPEYYDAEVFHRQTAPDVSLRLERRRLGDIGRFVRDGRILDVGCGAGRFMAAANASGWRTCGIEISSLAAKHAREHYGLEVIEEDILAAELPDEHFEVVTMWGVLEHLHHPKAALREVSRVLKPGGLFVALLPNIRSTQAKIFGSKWYLLDVPRHLYHFSQTTLNQLAKHAGLRPVWARFFAKEHDIPNLIQSLEAVLYPETRSARGCDSQSSSREPKRWTRKRILMGTLRRSAPLVARLMAGRRSSAAMEIYFRKVGPQRTGLGRRG